MKKQFPFPRIEKTMRARRTFGECADQKLFSQPSVTLASEVDMETFMNAMTKAILIGVSALSLSAGAASAAVVCNDVGECWHVRGRPVYEPGLRLSIHPDNWRWGRYERYRWREHRGHGYLREGVWIDIR